MSDREKVIKGLEICKEESKLCFGECECGYQSYFPRCWITLAGDAFALLKSQEPRVMTLEEVKTELVCWIEDVEAEVVFPAIYHCKGNPSKDGQYAIFATIQDSDILPEDYDDEQIIYQFDDGSRWLWEGNINKTWRPWTSRPTDAQRETKPWQ